MRVRENALYLVFKLVMRLSTNWRAINGRNQLSLLLAGDRFVDGRLPTAAHSGGRCRIAHLTDLLEGFSTSLD
jgi:hypothetical protein